MSNEIKNICVFGSGCPTCKNLFDLAKEVVLELGINMEVEYSDDIQKIIELGCMQTPVFVINDEPVLIGSVFSKEKIKQIIENKTKGSCLAGEDSENSGSCSCGGGCC